jgi:hypothetical protein
VGLNQCVFDFSMPMDTRCTVWMKTYVNGKLNQQLCQFQKCSPAVGEHLSGQLIFNRYDPSEVSEAASSKTRWYFGMRGWSSSWVDDPFKKTDHQSPTTYNHENMLLGRTYTIGYILGAKEDNSRETVFTTEGSEAIIAAKHAVVVVIKMRLDPSDTHVAFPEDRFTAGQVPEFDKTP